MFPHDVWGLIFAYGTVRTVGRSALVCRNVAVAAKGYYNGKLRRSAIALQRWQRMRIRRRYFNTHYNDRDTWCHADCPCQKTMARKWRVAGCANLATLEKIHGCVKIMTLSAGVKVKISNHLENITYLKADRQCRLTLNMTDSFGDYASYGQWTIPSVCRIVMTRAGGYRGWWIMSDQNCEVKLVARGMPFDLMNVLSKLPSIRLLQFDNKVIKFVEGYARQVGRDKNALNLFTQWFQWDCQAEIFEKRYRPVYQLPAGCSIMPKKVVGDQRALM